MKNILGIIAMVLLLASCGEDKDKKSLETYANEYCECTLGGKEKSECAEIIQKAKKVHGDDAKEEFLSHLDECGEGKDKKSLETYANEFCECTLGGKEKSECAEIAQEAKKVHGDDSKEEFLSHLDECGK